MSTVDLPHYDSAGPQSDLGQFIGKGVTFQQLAPASRRIPPPPRFLLGPVSGEVLAHFFRLGNLLPVGVYRAANIDIFDECLLSRDGILLRVAPLSLYPHFIVREYSALKALTWPRPRRMLSGTHVLLASVGSGVYGHWLVDFLPKLALLRAAGHDIDRMRFLLPTTARPFARALIGLLGFGAEQIVEFDPHAGVLTVEDLLIPTTMNDGVQVSPFMRDAAEILTTRLTARHGPLATGTTPPRIFLSRGGIKQSRGLANRARIEAMAAAAGFAMIAPETLPLLDQIRLFAGARVIAGEYGSALHGSLFSPAGTVVCGLRGDALHPHFIQSGIGNALEQPTGYIHGPIISASPTNPLHYSFEIREADFAQALDTVLTGTAV